MIRRDTGICISKVTPKINFYAFTYFHRVQQGANVKLIAYCINLYN